LLFASCISVFRPLLPTSLPSHTTSLPLSQKPCHHVVNMSHQCVVCYKSFKELSVLLSHAGVTDLDSIQAHNCDYCDKTCCSSRSLRHHQASQHGTMTHQCCVCRKRFKGLPALLKHTGVKYPAFMQAHKCDACDKICCSSIGLQEHQTSLHGVSTENTIRKSCVADMPMSDPASVHGVSTENTSHQSCVDDMPLNDPALVQADMCDKDDKSLCGSPVLVQDEVSVHNDSCPPNCWIVRLRAPVTLHVNIHLLVHNSILRQGLRT
jgi:hypothetical protein